MSDAGARRRVRRPWAALAAGLLASVAAAADRLEYVDNGQVRVGVNLGAGGSVCHFSAAPDYRNLVNHADRGRFIQQSFYGDSDGSRWGEKPWRWNPVQGGDYHGKSAPVLEFRPGETSLFVRSLAMHWATGEVLSNAVMEEIVRLDGPVARIAFRFTYRGARNHRPTHHELPAVFVDYALPNLVTYDGPTPWTDGPLTRRVPGWPNESMRMTESWAAYVDDQDQGIGVFTPGRTAMTCYRYKGDGRSGPTGSACSYFAPLEKFAVTNGLVFRYDVYLTAGSLKQIRERFAAIRARER